MREFALPVLPGKDPRLVDLTALGETLRPTRRRLLAAIGLSGVAVALPAVAPASAAPAPQPVRRPTDDDVALLAFAQSIELSIRDTYDAKLGTPITEPLAAVVREHHEAYAQALGGLIGTSAPNRPNEALSAALGEAESLNDVALAEIEATAAATHQWLLSQLVGTDGAALVASIMSAESRHVAAFRIRSGDVDGLIPESGSDSADGALDPSEFGVE